MVKQRPNSATTERMGVAEVQRVVTADLKWIFREQWGDDYGIDAHIEVVNRGEVSGRLIAAQIKSGASYFHPTGGGWWFYPNADDLQYWSDHALPVIVICVDLETAIAYWEAISEGTLSDTRKGGRKLFISDTKVLGSSSSVELSQLADGNPYEVRLRQLRLALPWMKQLQAGRRLTLDAREWINKSSGRGEVSVISSDAEGNDQVTLGEWAIWPGNAPYATVLPTLVPWADLSLHEETYVQAKEEGWAEGGGVLNDDGYPIWTQSYDDWSGQFDKDELRPYANGGGEVEDWRLEMTLNELGKGFLAVDAFAADKNRFLTPRRP